LNIPNIPIENGSRITLTFSREESDFCRIPYRPLDHKVAETCRFTALPMSNRGRKMAALRGNFQVVGSILRVKTYRPPGAQLLSQRFQKN
jgi:hypothetical protein